MTQRQQNTQTDTGVAGGDSILHSSSPATPPDSCDLTPEQIQRWAVLVADGTAPMPQGLSPAQQRQMFEQACRHRRHRLVCYLARQIALDLFRSSQSPAPSESLP